MFNKIIKAISFLVRCMAEAGSLEAHAYYLAVKRASKFHYNDEPIVKLCKSKPKIRVKVRSLYMMA